MQNSTKASQMTNSKAILVVDDDSTLHAGLQTMLQQNGYATLEADDGTEARDLIDKHRPDLVILDMMMPRWGGFAVLEHFQNNPAAPRFIMFTAHDGQKHQAYAKEIGVADYILKPCSMERLLQRIDLLLRTLEPAAAAETATIRVSCPGCGARIKAPVALIGQTRSCPRCNQVIVVREAPIDEGPKLI
jgi:DNA-binding response OmpR family regulator